jgi:pilus assembly protein CpaB
MKLARLGSLRLKRAWVVLGVAIVIGVLAALAARNYLHGRIADLETRARGKHMNVVVAKRDLAKGTRLSTENVAVRSVPVDYAHSNAVLPEQYERIEGGVLAFPVKSGEAVLWSLLEGRKAPTFSARVEAGRRAITVPVDEINSISGLLEPGDLIDLLVTVDRERRKVTVPLLEKVQVMATGQRSVDDPRSGERRSYSTVTLDIDPQQAQDLIVAREAGHLTALLRNPEDEGPLQGVHADFASLFQLVGGTAEPDGLREVPVLYGGRGGKFPPEGLHLGQYVESGKPARPGAAAAPQLPLGAAAAAGQIQVPAFPLELQSDNGVAPAAVGSAPVEGGPEH